MNAYLLMFRATKGYKHEGAIRQDYTQVSEAYVLLGHDTLSSL